MLSRYTAELLACPDSKRSISELRSEVLALNTLVNNNHARVANHDTKAMTAVDNAVVKVGEIIHRRAEEVYDAPTDGDIKRAIGDSTKLEFQLGLAKADKDNLTQYRYNTVYKEFNVLYEKLRVKIGLKPKYTTVMFARFQELIENGLSKEDAAELARIKEAIESTEQQVMDARSKYLNDKIARLSALIDEVDTKVKQLLLTRRTAFQQALRDAGVVFADAGSLSIDADSDTSAVSAVNEAVACFPQQWVEASNATGRLVLKDTRGRAYYHGQSTAMLQDGKRIDSIPPTKTTIYISPDHRTQLFSDNLGYRVAIHELSHCFEAVISGLYTLQESFLHRRAGFMNGKPEELKPIYLGKKEYGYRGGFGNPYAGKVYDDSHHREVLSIGMEALFAGSQYGLSYGRSSRAQPDPDYRNFILGALCYKVNSL